MKTQISFRVKTINISPKPAIKYKKFHENIM